MLTNAAVRSARPKAAAYKLPDGGGLHLYVAPTGLKSWRWRFRWPRGASGTEKLLTIGSYPEVTLDQAREAAERARTRRARGEDPRAVDKDVDAAPSTFEAAARAWHSLALEGWSPVHAGQVLASLERDVFPTIGADRLDKLEAPALLRLVRVIAARGSVVTARRIAERISCVYAQARLEGWTKVANPAAELVQGLAGAPAVQHHPALRDVGALRELLAAAELVDTALGVKLASRFLALTAVRFAVVRGARWCEIVDLDGAEPLWRVPAARMKLRVAKKGDAANDHLVPLAPAAVEVLRAARAIMHSGDANMHADAPIFASRGGGEIGQESIGNLYKRAGYAGRHVPHGWRASFSTIMNRGGHDSRVIERALGHATAGMTKVEAAYNRDEALDPRRALLEAWAALLVDDSAGGDARD